ncbi:metallophosphoesterase [Cnuibacter sp. UC19_7]|uniref:metallophosphoesterase n=1 Tax=Cnuibacter sp. UC19_7 TaxID=3350166 RepID=UPI00366D8D31
MTARSAAAALGVVAAAGAGAFAYGTLVERKLYTLRRGTMPVLPAGAPPIRVLHLSDLHMAPWQRDKQEWIRELARFEPDLVIDTGDNLGHRDAIPAVRHALEVFRGIPGVFVHGSNDYFGPSFKNPMRYFTGPSKQHGSVEVLDTRSLTEAFESFGWLDLDNRAGRLTINGTVLDFAGVDDPHRHYDRLDEATTALEQVRRDSPVGDGVLVGVAHAPYQRVLNSFVDLGSAAIFAGHTHGGQVCVPGFGALVTNCDIPRRQVKGLSTWSHGGRSADLNVSAGLGTSIYAPFRFACRPEASLITLTAASA